MRTDALVDRLSQNLRPVRPRSIKREALLLFVLGAIEVAAFVSMGFMRPDMPMAMETPSFWWKLVSMGLIAVLGAGVALMSADPVRSPRRGLRWILACIAVIFATGWLIDAAGDGVGGTGPSSRLDTRPPVRLEDGGVVDPPGYRLGWADTTCCPNRSLWDGTCRGAFLSCLGSVRLCLRLSFGRSALHRGLVHGRMLDRDRSRTGRFCCGCRDGDATASSNPDALLYLRISDIPASLPAVRSSS